MKLKKSLKLKISAAVGIISITALVINIIGFNIKADVLGPNEAPQIILPIDNARYYLTKQPLIQGRAQANVELTVYDGKTELGKTISDSGGLFGLKPPNPLEEGVHKFSVKNFGNNKTSLPAYIEIKPTDSKAILKASGTQIIEDDHPYFGSGNNDFTPILDMMDDPSGSTVEARFALYEKTGIKMVRVRNYMIDDIALPDPISAPNVTAVDGGGRLLAGDYVYRYSCANLSKARVGIDAAPFFKTAETKPSPATSTISVSDNQKVTMTLTACAKSYRYYIYRRAASDAEGSEALVGGVEGFAGNNVTFVDDGTIKPATIWPDPALAPILLNEAGGQLSAGTYVYRYLYAQKKQPVDGRDGLLVEGGVTRGSPTSEITVQAGEKIKVSIPGSDLGSVIGIYRRLSTEAPGQEKWIATIYPSQTGETSWYDDGQSNPSSYNIGTNNTTQTINPSLENQTHDNPRTAWTTGHQGKAFVTGLGNYNEDTFVALDKVLALARKYNIRILFTFFDQQDDANSTGGIREIARQTAVCKNCFYSNPTTISVTKAIIDKFLERTNTVSGVPYKNEPAIFAWELINEPWDTQSGLVFRGWLTNVGGYLKSKDSNHLLSSGDDGSVWFIRHDDQGSYNYNNNHDFVTMGNIPSIDLLTWHGYPGATNNFMFNYGYFLINGQIPAFAQDPSWLAKYGPVHSPINTEQAIFEMQRRANYGAILNKPIIFGEWGIKGNSSDWQDPAHKDWIDRISDAILTIKPELPGPNIIPNGDFREGLAHWHSDPGAWKPNKFTVDSAVQYNGHNVLKVTGIEGGYDNILFSEPFPIKPKTEYWLEAALKTKQESPPAIYDKEKLGQIKIVVNKYFKADGQEVASGNQSIVSYDKNWKIINRMNTDHGLSVVYFTFTTPSDVTQAEILIKFEQRDGNRFCTEDTGWIGEVRLKEFVPGDNNTPLSFSGTGWEGLPNNDPVTKDLNNQALRDAAVNFDAASFANLPALFHEPEPPDGGNTNENTNGNTNSNTDTNTNTNSGAISAGNTNKSSQITKKRGTTADNSNLNQNNNQNTNGQINIDIQGQEEISFETESGNMKLKIKKFHYNALFLDRYNLNDEYIIIENTGKAALNTSSWIIKNSKGEKYVMPSRIIDPKESLTIKSGKTPKVKCYRWYVDGKWQKICQKPKQNVLYMGRETEMWQNRHDRMTIYAGNVTVTKGY